MYPYIVFYALVALAGWWLILAFHYGVSRRVVQTLLGATLCAVSLWTWQVSEPTVLFSDFNVAYYPAGRAVLEDLPHLFTRCWDTPVCGFVNLPVVAFLFTPFSMVTLRHAQWLFIVLSLVSVALSLCLLWSMTDEARSRRWAILFLFAINGPLFYSFKEGNLTHFVLLLLIAGVVCLDKTWEYRAGICFALAAIIKLPLLLFAVYFLGKGHWKVVGTYAATLIGVVALSVWYAGWSSHTEWYREVILPFSNKGLGAFNVQSLEGFILRLQDNIPLYDWKPVEVDGNTKLAERIGTVLLGGLTSFLFLRHSSNPVRETNFLELSMVLCLSLIISPISWSHYYGLLLLPLGLYIGNRLPISNGKGSSAVMGIGTLLITPPVLFVGQNAGSQSPIANLMVSHYLMGALVLWGLMAYARWSMAETHHLRLMRTSQMSRPANMREEACEIQEPEASRDQRAAG
jgi:hypothetical protein